MPNQRNINQVNQITDRLNETKAVYLVDHQGLGANDMNVLREKIRQAGGQLMVVKNTLFTQAIRRVNENSPMAIKEDLDLKDTSGALFAQEDQLSALKAAIEFAKESELPKIKMGILDGRVLSAEQVEALSKLPGLEQMRGQAVGMLASPLSRLVGSLQGNLSKLVIVLSKISAQDKQD